MRNRQLNIHNLFGVNTYESDLTLSKKKYFVFICVEENVNLNCTLFNSVLAKNLLKVYDKISNQLMVFGQSLRAKR